jgi:ATP-dependent Lon protease
MGGDILFIEAAAAPGGKGKLILTGQLGDVMKESAQIALTLARSLSPCDKRAPFDFATHDVHIHIPAGGIPKDGPSAGVTLISALSSMISGRSLDPALAMTGEITLRGSVLPVGGIKEKLLAAQRAGINRVILPLRNKQDLHEIPVEIQQSLTFHFVESVDEVLQLALGFRSSSSFDQRSQLQPVPAA